MKSRFKKLAVLGLSVTTIGGMSVTASAAEIAPTNTDGVTAVEAPAEETVVDEVATLAVETTPETETEADETPVVETYVETPVEEETVPDTISDGTGESDDVDVNEDADGTGEEDADVNVDDGTDEGADVGTDGGDAGEDVGTGSGNEGGSGSEGETGSGEDTGDTDETPDTTVSSMVEASGLDFDGTGDVALSIRYVSDKAPSAVYLMTDLISINGKICNASVTETAEGGIVTLSKDAIMSLGLEKGQSYQFTLQNFELDVMIDGEMHIVPVNGTFTLNYFVDDEGEGSGEEGGSGNEGGTGSGEEGGSGNEGGSGTEEGTGSGSGEEGSGSGEEGTGSGEEGTGSGEEGTGSEDENKGDDQNKGDDNTVSGGAVNNGDNGNSNTSGSNNGGNSGNTAVTSANKAPQTGDMTPILPYAGGMLGSLGLAVTAFLRKFRK